MTRDSTLNDREVSLSLEDEWNKLMIGGDVNAVDRLLLKMVFLNPGATVSELAGLAGVTVRVASRRLNKPDVLKARMLIEGTVADQFEAAAAKYARLVNKTLDDCEEGPEAVIDRLWAQYGDPENADAFKVAVRMVEKRYDPQLAHEMGKAAVAFLAKREELALKNREVSVQERAAPLTPAEARKVIEADITQQPDVKVEIPEL
jgi:hypothetical protein